VLKDGPTRPAIVTRVREDKFEITITEGRNRQVRRMTAAVGFPALRLIRIAIGPYALGGLRPGEWKDVHP